MSEPVKPTTDFSRRQFVTASTAAIGAASMVTPSLAWIRGDDTIKVGLIGCGGRGTGAAGQALNADQGAVLWAMGDAFGDRLQSSHDNLVAHAGGQRAPRRDFQVLLARHAARLRGAQAAPRVPPHAAPARLRQMVGGQIR